LAFGLTLGPLAGCGEKTKSTARSHAAASTAKDQTPATEMQPKVFEIRKSDLTSGRSTVAADTVGEFAKHGTGASELSEPFGVAVNNRTGDVYVVDSNNFRVAQFTSGGRFLRAWGSGVADGRTKAFQTCVSRCFAGLEGRGLGELAAKSEGVAVDNDPSSPAYGDIYVVDLHNSRVQKFGPNGKPLLAFGAEVNQTATDAGDHADEDVCPVKPRDVCGPGTPGRTPGQLEFAVEGSFIAVGAHGVIYVGQRNSVVKYSPAGRYLSQVKLSPSPPSPAAHGAESGGVSALVVDKAGNMYVARNEIAGINVYSPSGQLLRTLEPGGQLGYPEGPAPAMALGTDGHVYIDVYAQELHRVDEYNADGRRIASFDIGRKAPAYIADKEDGLPGIAYLPRGKKLYLVNADVNLTPLVARVRVVRVP
jgi:DNA-binding beta-propeller fold protein YncE